MASTTASTSALMASTVMLNASLASSRTHARKSMAYVLSPEQQQSLPSGLKFALDRYGWADALALHFQRRTRQTVCGVLLVAFLAAVCIQVYSYVGTGSRWLACAYLVAMCVAYAWYAWCAGGAITTTSTWTTGPWRKVCASDCSGLAGLKEEVPDHYLRRRGELDWIRQAIRVWTIPTKMEALRPSRSRGEATGRLQIVLDRWVSDQAAFFRRQAGATTGATWCSATWNTGSS